MAIKLEECINEMGTLNIELLIHLASKGHIEKKELEDELGINYDEVFGYISKNKWDEVSRVNRDVGNILKEKGLVKFGRRDTSFTSTYEEDLKYPKAVHRSAADFYLEKAREYSNSGDLEVLSGLIGMFLTNAMYHLAYSPNMLPIVGSLQMRFLLDGSLPRDVETREMICSDLFLQHSQGGENYFHPKDPNIYERCNFELAVKYLEKNKWKNLE